eukprot:TRINITY_DN1911_c0_g1_i6.p1 TRINITY_DN1911_c0_g1~~TRINITY_DN1911_c0_g1_i6.p1  ORF type:complete len:621 (-),score=54.70 TRINITY_DN1911_c0_g1_i6:313-2088(-)
MTNFRLLVLCLSLALQGRAQAASECSLALGDGPDVACAERDRLEGGVQQGNFEFVQLNANKLKSRPPAIELSVTSASGGDWTSVECDAGWKAIGGGCHANVQFPQMNGPDGERGWKCGGHSGTKKVWVRCARGIDVEVKEVSGGDWTTVQCDPGRKVISGGCNAYGHPFKMQYNGPGGNETWKCGGHGGRKRVWAICALGINVSTVEAEGGDWTESTCAPGQQLLGGGCSVYEGYPVMSYSAPPDFDADYYNAWKCGGHGGKKRVWATCWEPPAPRPCTSFTSAETCPTSRCNVFEGQCRDFDVFVIANNTDLSVGKSYKDMTRDPQGCANLCAGEFESFVWSRTSGACWCAKLSIDYSDWIASDDTAYFRVGSGIFGGKACRLDKSDKTTNGEGSVNVVWGVSFGDCVSRCKAANSTCTGVEYGHGSKRCELWTKPIGYLYNRGGFECVNLVKPSVCSAPDASQLNTEYPCSCGLATCGDSSTLCHSLQDYCDTPKPTPSPTPPPTFFRPHLVYVNHTKLELRGPFSYNAKGIYLLGCSQKCKSLNSPCFDYIHTNTESTCKCLVPTGDCHAWKTTSYWVSHYVAVREDK